MHTDIRKTKSVVGFERNFWDKFLSDLDQIFSIFRRNENLIAAKFTANESSRNPTKRHDWTKIQTVKTQKLVGEFPPKFQ